MPDVYRVGVSIAMTSNAAQVLGVLGKDLLGIGLKAKDLEGGLNRIKIAAIGLGGVVAGAAILGGMAKLVEHGKEFVHQQSLMAQAGVSQVDIANATGAAWKNATGILNAGASDNLKLLSDLRNEFGRMDEAVKASPAFTKLGVVTAGITGGDAEQAGYAGSRFFDLRGSLVDPKTGQISEARAEQQARLLEAITVATRGRVGTSELLNFQKQARGAGSTLTDQGLINMVPVIQAMGGYRTGTSLTSMMQEVIGGRLTQQAGKFLEDAGVLDPSKVSVRRGGQMIVGAGGVRDQQLLATNPVQYINTVLRAGLIRMGATTPEQQTILLMRDGLRQTVNGLITEVIRNYVPFSRDAANITQAATVDQYKVLSETDPTVRMQAFETAWKNLLTALGAPIVNDATGIITKLTGALNRLTAWASSHPQIVGDIELVAAGLGALAAIGGSLAIAGAALGPFVTGLRGLVVILGGAEVATAAGSLIAFGGAITVVAAAVAGLPPLMNWLAHQIGPVGDAKANSANRGHAGPVVVAPIGRSPYSRGNYHPTAFMDDDQPHAQPISLQVNLDGRQVATSVSTHLVRLMRPNANGGTTSWDPLSTPTPPGLVTA